MAKMDKLDRRGSGPWFFIAIAALTFFIYSLALAVSTADDCGEGAPKHWSYWPPEWVCERSPGFG